MLKKIKDIIIGSRLAGKVIYQKIATGVVKANEPNILREFGGSLELTEVWSQNVLEGMDGVKRKGMTGKFEPCPKFIEGKNLRFNMQFQSLFLIMISH